MTGKSGGFSPDGWAFVGVDVFSHVRTNIVHGRQSLSIRGKSDVTVLQVPPSLLFSLVQFYTVDIGDRYGMALERCLGHHMIIAAHTYKHGTDRYLLPESTVPING